MKITKRFKTVDEYIKAQPKIVAQKLKILRSVIKISAKGATEVISYNMPAYKLNGILLYFAGYPSHIGFYPYPSATKALEKELSKYKTGKSTVRFPLDKPLPINLIKKIVAFRVKEKLSKNKKK